MLNNKIIIGTITKTRGLNGEVKVFNFSSFPLDRYKIKKKVYIDEDQYTISKVIFDEKVVYLTFKEITDIDKAKLLINKEIYVLSAKLPKLEKDTFYYHQLIGLEVIEDGIKLGTVSNVIEYPSSHNIFVTGDKNFNFPFVSNFVKNIDLVNKTINIYKIEGLYED